MILSVSKYVLVPTLNMFLPYSTSGGEGVVLCSFLSFLFLSCYLSRCYFEFVFIGFCDGLWGWECCCFIFCYYLNIESQHVFIGLR